MPGTPLELLRDLRSRHEREVAMLIAQALAAGASSQDVADALGASRATLRRRYGDHLRRPRRPSH